MKCFKCEKAITETGPLHRTAPLGQSPANWTCTDCLKKHEPELLSNIEDDKDLIQLLKDLS